MRLVVLAMFTCVLLSGCGAVQEDTHFTVADDAPSSADTHTGDGYDLRVRVVDQAGQPVEGAAVVYFLLEDSFTGEAVAGAEAGEGGARANAVAFYEFSFTNYEMIAGTRTDSEGYAVADLAPGGSIHVAAGDAPGMTTEVRMNVAKGSAGQTGNLEIPLYPDRIEHTFVVIMGNQVGHGGIAGTPSEAHPMLLSEDAELQEAYAARIEAFDLLAAWSNTPTVGGADIYLGAGTADDVRWVGQDRDQFDFENEEELQVSSSDLDGHRAELTELGHHVHLMTDKVAVSWGGLPVTITVDADLKGSNIVIN